MSEAEWVPIQNVDGAFTRNAKAPGARINRYSDGMYQACANAFRHHGASPSISVILHTNTEEDAERLAVIAVAIVTQAMDALIATERQNDGGTR